MTRLQRHEPFKSWQIDLESSPFAQDSKCVGCGPKHKKNKKNANSSGHSGIPALCPLPLALFHETRCMLGKFSQLLWGTPEQDSNLIENWSKTSCSKPLNVVFHCCGVRARLQQFYNSWGTWHRGASHGTWRLLTKRLSQPDSDWLLDLPSLLTSNWSDLVSGVQLRVKQRRSQLMQYELKARVVRWRGQLQ